MIKFIVKQLWKQYCKDENVIYCTNPPGKSVFSAEGFLMWLLDKHPLDTQDKGGET